MDGGTTAQVFVYPAALRLKEEAVAIGATRERRMYLIRNARLDPYWADVRRRTLGIVGRAISTMITASGYNDVLRIYNTTRQDDIGYHLAYIGKDFTMTLPEPFDLGYARALFDYGYQQARHGYDWKNRPPGI